ncbi:hypothetical protein ACIG56_07240 [Nocardia fusca]|uniref:hypothetical protein n=1 Tax=Nocardia fusca TaxID=941183 RepID=UPI0037C848EB
MSGQGTTRPGEPDLCLSIFLHGIRLEYVACRLAALLFMAEWRHRHAVGSVAVIPASAADLPRLPCERLYVGEQ